jgi:hypothetical protein
MLSNDMHGCMDLLLGWAIPGSLLGLGVGFLLGALKPAGELGATQPSY